jgi:hypothetical protein
MGHQYHLVHLKSTSLAAAFEGGRCSRSLKIQAHEKPKIRSHFVPASKKTPGLLMIGRFDASIFKRIRCHQDFPQ